MHADHYLHNALILLVADAVTYEPVSTPNFPANREINGVFHRIRALGAILKADMRANSEACSKIPYATEQGIILKEQGNLALEQGISESSPDEVVGTHNLIAG